MVELEPAGPLPTDDELGLIRHRPVPQHGWRKLIHRASRGAVNPGESQQDLFQKALIGRVNRPVHGDCSIAVLSMKGGVGKTTVTVGLGVTFAALRGDRVIAVDANPDFGTLAQRGPSETGSTVRDLLLDQDISRYSDIRRYTSQGPSRLEILASERDPAVSERFSEAEYRRRSIRCSASTTSSSPTAEPGWCTRRWQACLMRLMFWSLWPRRLATRHAAVWRLWTG